MVFTHIPSNILLILVAFAPTFPLAVALYLARVALSQMDVPTRQSYLVAVVKENERTAAAGITNISRNITQSIWLYTAVTITCIRPICVGRSIENCI
jgi:sugar phosphate permease